MLPALFSLKVNDDFCKHFGVRYVRTFTYVEREACSVITDIVQGIANGKGAMETLARLKEINVTTLQGLAANTSSD